MFNRTWSVYKQYFLCKYNCMQKVITVVKNQIDQYNHRILSTYFLGFGICWESRKFREETRWVLVLKFYLKKIIIKHQFCGLHNWTLRPKLDHNSILLEIGPMLQLFSPFTCFLSAFRDCPGDRPLHGHRGGAAHPGTRPAYSHSQEKPRRMVGRRTSGLKNTLGDMLLNAPTLSTTATHTFYLKLGLSID